MSRLLCGIEYRELLWSPEEGLKQSDFYFVQVKRPPPHVISNINQRSAAALRQRQHPRVSFNLQISQTAVTKL